MNVKSLHNYLKERTLIWQYGKFMWTLVPAANTEKCWIEILKHIFFFKKNLFIYLAAPDLRCGMRDLF